MDPRGTSHTIKMCMCMGIGIGNGKWMYGSGMNGDKGIVEMDGWGVWGWKTNSTFAP